jgi:octaprenyl-diphosphate synthase
MLRELYRPVQAELDEVEAKVTDLWLGALRFVHGPSAAWPRAAGKMLRPALCLLAAGAAGATDRKHFVSIATTMELLHLAALTHDDVIDGSPLRRGVRSLNAHWDSHAAVLGGDYLVAHAITILGGYGSCALIMDTMNSIRQMTEGELMSFGRGLNSFTREDCIRLARQKTASLFAVACSAPTYFTPLRLGNPLHEYGSAVGVAFQLIDDLLDLSQDEAILGKPTCSDLVQGKKTLPVLLIREALEDGARARFDGMREAVLTEDDRKWVASVLESTGARQQTEAIAREHVDRARAALDELPPGIYRDSMLGVAEFVLTRGS